MTMNRFAPLIASLVAAAILSGCVEEPMTTRTAISTRQIRSGLPVPNDTTILQLPDVGGAPKVVPVDAPMIEKGPAVGRSVSVRQLVSECRDVGAPAAIRLEVAPSGPPCALRENRAEFWMDETRTRTVLHKDELLGVAGFTVVVGGLSGLIYCAAECKGGGQAASQIGLGAVVVAAGAGLLWLVSLSARGD